MADKILNSRIIHKHDIEANWLKAENFVPKQGELIVYDVDENYNYERVKMGDGVHNVNDLEFIIEYFSMDEIDEICGMTIISSDDDYVDKTTGAKYRLYVDNGDLRMTEVE